MGILPSALDLPSSLHSGPGPSSGSAWPVSSTWGRCSAKSSATSGTALAAELVAVCPSPSAAVGPEDGRSTAGRRLAVLAASGGGVFPGAVVGTHGRTGLGRMVRILDTKSFSPFNPFTLFREVYADERK